MVAVDSDAQALPAVDVSDSPFDDPINLAFTVDELIDGLQAAVAHGEWMNATFAAAGILQAIDDVTAGTSSVSGRLTKSVSKSSPVFGRLAFGWIRMWRAAHPSRSRRWRLFRTRHLLSAIAVASAAKFVDELSDDDVEVLVDRLARYVSELPEPLRTAVARIPSSFRSFDQHPDDLAQLVLKFVATHGNVEQPVVIVGVRTSGVYLAPFIAVLLRRAGYADVAVLSTRSEQPLSLDDARTLRRYAKQDALVVITDDPPSSGYALAAVGKSLESYGVAESAIHLLLAAFDDGELPQRLSGYSSTVLPFTEWSIHDRLSPRSIRVAIEELLHPVLVTDCVVVPFVKNSGRAHSSARIVATVQDNYGTHELTLLAEGVGLGYFGDHDRAVNERLGSTPPDVLGVRDGVLFREWLSEDSIKTPDVSDVVTYIKRRTSVFREPKDRSLDIAGSQPVWEVASEQIANVYGKYWPVARILFVDRLVKSILKSQHLAVPDGAMQAQRWFTIAGEVRKVDVSTRAFGNLDLQTFDPAYDAVAFSVDHGGDTDSMRAEFSRRIEPLSNEKWLLYELVRLWDDQRLDVVDQYEAANSRGTALRRYLSNTLLNDIQPNAIGPVVALDVDGVLETEVFGFKAPSPSSVLAVRALIQHGYRPVAVTGRCVDDVQEFCSMLCLAAGVAEYGSAIVLPDGDVTPMITDVQNASLQSLRERLKRADGVRVDDRYRYSVRASSVGRDGKLSTLDADLAECLLTDDFQQVIGALQTDFTSADVNKGRSIRSLCELMGEPQLALAVGDTDADISLLEIAAKRGVPSHATSSLKAVANIKARHPYQVGLAEIVSEFLGHTIGSCPTCVGPTLSDEAKAMVALLQTTEGSKNAVPGRTLRALLAARRAIK